MVYIEEFGVTLDEGLDWKLLGPRIHLNHILHDKGVLSLHQSICTGDHLLLEGI